MYSYSEARTAVYVEFLSPTNYYHIFNLLSVIRIIFIHIYPLAAQIYSVTAVWPSGLRRLTRTEHANFCSPSQGNEIICCMCS
jgi:hypothetical protein